MYRTAISLVCHPQGASLTLDIALVDLVQLRGDTYCPSVCFQHRLFSARVAGIMFAVIVADIGMLRCANRELSGTPQIQDLPIKIEYGTD